MFFQRVNRTDPEKVFIVVKNSYSTAAITVGQAVVFDYADTNEADGVAVTIPATATLKLPAGIVESASIADGSYGLIQVYGHNTNALTDGTTGLGVGDALKISNGIFNLKIAPAVAASGVDTAAVSYPFVCGAADSTGAAAANTVFIKCM